MAIINGCPMVQYLAKLWYVVSFQRSAVRVQASALDVGSDVTIQRYSFIEILELILHSCNVNYVYIFRILYFLGRLTFQSYRELVIIPLQFAYRNIFSRFLTFNHYNWRSNQPRYIDRMFSQIDYVMKKFIASISIQVLNSI